MRIVILNNSAEAVDYGKKHRKTGDVILPIGPTARHHALKQGWEIRTLSSLWTKEDYFKSKAESEQRIKILVEELNEYSKCVAKNFPLTIGHYFHFQLHVVIGQIHYNRFIIESIARSLKPKSWLLYLSNDTNLFRGFRPAINTLLQGVFMLSPYFDNSVVLLGSIGKRNKKENKTWKQKIRNLLPPTILEKVWLFMHLFKIGNIISFRKRKLLMLGAPFDWLPIFKNSEFKKSNHVYYGLHEQLYRNESKSPELDVIINRSICYNCIPAYDISKQVKLIHGTMQKMDKQVLGLKRNISKYQAILSTVFVFPQQNLIGHLANTLMIPVINWQHGEMNLYDNPFTEAVETKYTNYYLCYGKGVKSKYDNNTENSSIKKVFTVGSTKKSIQWKSGKYILYATGKWKKTSIPFIDAQDPDTRLYNAQRDILTYLDEIGQRHEVIFKTGNQPGLNEVPFTLNNVKIEYNLPFIKLLENAICVILDSPATTCIETCITEVPLFLLAGRSPWYQKPTKLIAKRAVVANTTEDLIINIDKYLEKGIYKPDIKNKEFLLSYGSVRELAKVEKDVVSILEGIIES